MAKRVPKASKRRLVVVTPIIIFVTFYLLFTVGYYGFKLISLKNQQLQLSNDLTQLQAEEKELKTEIQKLKDPEYLARYAREHFLYSKEGEYIIRLEKETPQLVEDNSFFRWIENYFEYVLIGLGVILFGFILFVFKRNKKSSHLT